MRQPTGSSGVGVLYTDDDFIGEAYERANEASEFGLPENYDDPHTYRGKAPAPDRIIGNTRS